MMAEKLTAEDKARILAVVYLMTRGQEEQIFGASYERLKDFVEKEGIDTSELTKQLAYLT